MYGLVNKGVRDFVIDFHGKEVWQRVQARAGAKHSDFISMEGCPDSVSYSLIESAAAELSISSDQLLEGFGEHWILYTAKQGYGELLDVSGASLREFLHNLNLMHARIALSYTNLRQPSFSVTEETDEQLLLHYRSHREGLTSMMTGLLRGLSKKFNEQVEVSLQESVSGGHDHDVFLVRWELSV